MELYKVESNNFENVIQKTLKTLVSDEDYEDIKEGLLLELEEGSLLYAIKDDSEDIGFIIITPLIDEDSPDKAAELLSVGEIYIQSDKKSDLVAELLARGLKDLRKEYKCNQVEIIISQSVSWLGDTLQEYGFICAEVKLEKVLPTPNNLADVLELIRDCTPIDRIVQVLLERDEEFQVEILEDVEEIMEQLDDGWIPVIVVVTYEPESLKVQEIVESSNQIIKWDDFSLIYRGE
ncbi:MAG: hypothetical protein ACXAD7_06975 [Candidatus Kariarchaeaceae archaeon]|jgi:hypothetical protein